jgi:hypothetical protein
MLMYDERISPVYRSAMGDHAYLVRAPDFADLRPLIEYAHATQNSEWKFPEFMI